MARKPKYSEMTCLITNPTRCGPARNPAAAVGSRRLPIWATARRISYLSDDPLVSVVILPFWRRLRTSTPVHNSCSAATFLGTKLLHSTNLHRNTLRLFIGKGNSHGENNVTHCWLLSLTEQTVLTSKTKTASSFIKITFWRKILFVAVRAVQNDIT
jgi:hypothetical protein